MQIPNRLPNPDSGEPLSESSVERLFLTPSQAFDNGLKLPAANRAKIAKFCYQRVHMRELGLRLAATCDMKSLVTEFGKGAETVFKQSRNIERTLDAHRKVEKSSKTPPITLAGPALK